MKRIYLSLVVFMAVFVSFSTYAQNKVLSLDGDGDYIEISGVTFGYDALTIEVWAWLSSGPSIHGGSPEIVGTPNDPIGEIVLTHLL